jgi:hypothetical protein
MSSDDEDRSGGGGGAGGKSRRIELRARIDTMSRPIGYSELRRLFKDVRPYGSIKVRRKLGVCVS